MKKFLLPISLILSMAVVLMLTNSFQENTTHFYGLADNQEQSVSFQEPVKIVEINVIEGQYVEQGTVLLKAERSHLTTQKNQLSGQIEELNAQQHEAKTQINAEIEVLRAQESAELARLNIQIAELRSRQKQNIDLYKNILGTLPKARTPDPLQTQINLLIKQQQQISRSIQTQIKSLRVKLNAAKEPIRIKKKLVENSLEEINRQQEELIIKADFSGRIGNINHKRGEQIAAFQPILTVYGLYPKMVKGYIHENVSNDVKIGQRVWIHSLSSKNKNIAIEGRVESLGSRIIEYPERLKKNPMLRSWGREVNIRLPINNTLLLGEKVQVSFSPQRPNTMEAFFKPFGGKKLSLFPHAYAEY